MIESALERFRQVADERGFGLEALHVDRAGSPPVEMRWRADLRHDVYSVSKTFTSVAIGIAQGEGLLALDDPVLTHLPQFAETAAPGVEGMTIRHLLTMTAGNDYAWEAPDADCAGDAAQMFLAAPLVAEPGTRYRYAGTNSYVLGRIVHSCSGQDLRDFLVPRLFGPLGIANPQWHRCPLGFPIGAVGLFLRAREIGRLGRVLLDDGVWGGRQLVPADYVRLMRATRIDTGRADADNRTYALHAWQCARDGAWRMDGIYGQFAVMLPAQDACISLTAHYEGPTTDILDALWEELVHAL
jgi:CubicO group peptidase (beta-lactamase class C family)